MGTLKVTNQNSNKLYTPWGETIDKTCPLNNYPRPQMRRNNWQCLNGQWQYAISQTSQEPTSYDGQILVPFSPETLLSGVEKTITPQQTLWYKQSFTLEPKGEKEKRILHFGAVDQCCRVWCNGHLLGEHFGGYWPFSFDISAYGNSVTICLAVQDSSDMGNEAYGKQKIERGKIWYTGQSGIWQTVWCEIVPEEYIQKVDITPNCAQNEVLFEVETSAKGGTVAIKQGEEQVATAKLINGKAAVKLENHILWTQENPFLYTAEITAGEDVVQSYFGMRTFGKIKGADGIVRPTLNGKEIFYNGLLDQGYWSDGMYTPPSDEAMIWEIKQIKEMGFNMLRKHIKIEPLRWYYHCDCLGVLVWQDFVSGGGPYKDWVIRKAPWLGINFKDSEKRHALHGRQSQQGKANFIRDAKRTVELLKNVVSIGVWVPFNEGWGQFDAQIMHETVKSMDATRLIDHASGYFDQGKGDFHSYHIYYKRFRPRKDKVENRILALTEFGGYTLPTPDHMMCDTVYGYKIFENKEQMGKGLEELYEKDVYANIKKGLGGIVYTQVSDVEDETNGLFTYDRKVTKVDIEQIKKINTKVYKLFEEKLKD